MVVKKPQSLEPPIRNPDQDCFCGLISIKFGVLICGGVGLLLFTLALVFNLVLFFTTQYYGLHAFAWYPHIAVLITLLVIAMVIYSLVCFVSLTVGRIYSNAAYLIFLIMNIVTLLFHLFFAIIAFSLAFALIEFAHVQENPTSSSAVRPTTPINGDRTNTRTEIVIVQFARSLVYWILVLFQVYSQFVVARMRTYWIHYEAEDLPPAAKKPKTNKIRPTK